MNIYYDMQALNHRERVNQYKHISEIFEEFISPEGTKNHSFKDGSKTIDEDDEFDSEEEEEEEEGGGSDDDEEE